MFASDLVRTNYWKSWKPLCCFFFVLKTPKNSRSWLSYPLKNITHFVQTIGSQWTLDLLWEEASLQCKSCIIIITLYFIFPSSMYAGIYVRSTLLSTQLDFAVMLVWPTQCRLSLILLFRLSTTSCVISCSYIEMKLSN